MRKIIIGLIMLFSLSFFLTNMAYAYKPLDPPEYAYVVSYAEEYARMIANPEFLHINYWKETENGVHLNHVTVSVGVGHPGYVSQTLIVYVDKDTREVEMVEVFVGGGETKPKWFYSKEKMLIDTRTYVSEKTGVPLEEVYLWWLGSDLSGWWEGNHEFTMLYNVRGEDIYVTYSNGVIADLIPGLLQEAREKLAGTLNPTGNDQLVYDHYADHNTNDVTFIFTLQDGSKVDVLVDKDTGSARINEELEAAALHVRGMINSHLGTWTPTGERIEHDVRIDSVTQLPVTDPVRWGDQGQDKILILDSYAFTVNVENYTIKTETEVGVYEEDPSYYAVWDTTSSLVNNDTGVDLLAEGFDYIKSILNVSDPDNLICASWIKGINNRPNDISFSFIINSEDDYSGRRSIYVNIDTAAVEMTTEGFFLEVRNLVKDEMTVGLEEVHINGTMRVYTDGVVKDQLTVRIGENINLNVHYYEGQIDITSITNLEGEDLIQSAKDYLADKLGITDSDSLDLDYRVEDGSIVFTFASNDANNTTLDIKVDPVSGSVVEAIKKKEYHYHDTNGNLVSSTYITKTYDGTGTIRHRNTSWESQNTNGYSGSGEYDYYYNESGNLISMNGSYSSTYGGRTYGGEYSYTYTYDANDRLVTMEGNWRYTYDGKVSEGHSSYRNYYDENGNLIKRESSYQSTYNGTISESTSTYTYTYDADGNLLTMQGSWQSSYGGNTSEGESSYRNNYDANGNIIKRTSIYRSSYNGREYEGVSVYDYVYDADGKITSIEGESSYLYKEAGVVTRKIESGYSYDYTGGDLESWSMTTLYDENGTATSKNAYIYMRKDGQYDRYRVDYEDVNSDGYFDLTRVYDKDNNMLFNLAGDISPEDVINTIKNPPVYNTMMNETDRRLELEAKKEGGSIGGITLVPNRASKKSSTNILQ